jgi:hypothetical protein
VKDLGLSPQQQRRMARLLRIREGIIMGDEASLKIGYQEVESSDQSEASGRV